MGLSGSVEYLEVRHRGTTPCIRDHHRAWSYHEFTARVDAAAAQLAAAGTGRGTTIATLLPNRLELMVALMAVWRLGATAAPVDPEIGRARAEQQIFGANALLVLDNRTILSPGLRLGGAPCMPVEILPRRRPAAWQTPPAPKADDIALVYPEQGCRPAHSEIPHGDLDRLARQTTEHLGLTASAHCSISLPLVRAEVIAMNFLAAILLGAPITLVTGRSGAPRTPATRRPSVAYGLRTSPPSIHSSSRLAKGPAR